MNSRPAFYDLSEFPKLKELVESWQIVRDEYALLDVPLMNVNRAGKSHREVQNEIVQRVIEGDAYGWVEGWGQDGGGKDWTQFGLVMNDQPIPFAKGAMPNTLDLLSDVNGIHVAALSRLGPHAMLPTHRHPELSMKGLLQFHVTISSVEERNYAYLNVAGEFRQHTNGSAFVFDGSHDHFAINFSDHERIIVYIEFFKDAMIN